MHRLHQLRQLPAWNLVGHGLHHQGFLRVDATLWGLKRFDGSKLVDSMHSSLPNSTWTRSRDHQCWHRRIRRPPLPTSPSPVRRYLVTRVFDPLVILPRLLLKHSILAIASRLVQQEIDPQIHGADLQHCSSDAIRCVHYVSPCFEVPMASKNWLSTSPLVPTSLWSLDSASLTSTASTQHQLLQDLRRGKDDSREYAMCFHLISGGVRTHSSYR